MWPGRTPAEAREVARHEALANDAFTGIPIAFLCPYHAGELTEGILADAHRTHIQRHGHTRPSPGYDGAALAAALAVQPLSAPPTDTATFDFDHLDDLAAVRHHVGQHAQQVGLGGNRIHELVLTVNELVTNTLLHGGAGGTIHTWYESDTLICQVTGPGHITDTLAGRHPPDTESDGPHGLWLVNHRSDLTEERTGTNGTTTRVHTRVR